MIRVSVWSWGWVIIDRAIVSGVYGHVAKMDVGLVHPWTGFDWVGLGTGKR